MINRLDISTNSPAFFWSVIVTIICASTALRFGGTTPDVSWLIDMCERILNGEKAYIDIFETTPPIPMLLYMPGALFSQLTGMSAEFCVYALAYGSAVAAFAVTLRILPDYPVRDIPTRWAIIFPAAFFLFVLSTDAFAQREFFAAAFMLPMVAVFVSNAENDRWPPVTSRLWAALFCGLSVAIKPPLFALPAFFLAGFYLFRTRQFRFIYSSGLIAAAIFSAALTLVSLLAFPDYLSGVLTLMRDVYTPYRVHYLISLQPAFIVTLLCLSLIGVLMFNAKLPASTGFFAVTALGYIAAYFAQGKFFAYHLLPAVMFVFIALWTIFVRQIIPVVIAAQKITPKIMASLALVMIPVALLYDVFDDKRPSMEDMSWAKSIEKRPTAMAITPSIALSFPLAREVDAIWVDRIHSQWVSHYAKLASDQKGYSETQFQLFRQYQDSDLERTKNVIQQKRPELIFQCVLERHMWISDRLLDLDPALLDGYQVIAEDDVFRIWQLKPKLAATSQAF